MANIKKPIITVVILIIVAIIVISSMVRVVPAGSVQVLTRFSKVTGRVLQPGLNFIVPFINNTISYRFHH